MSEMILFDHEHPRGYKLYDPHLSMGAYCMIFVVYFPISYYILRSFYQEIKSCTSHYKTKQTKLFKESQCAICLDPIKKEVAADCGHVFCCKCILMVHQQLGNQIPCPTCRKPVNKLFQNYKNSGSQAKQEARLNLQIKQYNVLYDGNFGLIRFILQMPRSWIYINNFLGRSNLQDYQNMLLRLLKYRFILQVYISNPFNVLPAGFDTCISWICDIIVAISVIIFFKAMKVISQNRRN